MDQVITINASEYVMGKAPQVLVTIGVGSCVAICLYAPKDKVGALLHIMLPVAENDSLNPMRFADSALGFVFLEFEKRGISRASLKAKLVGGAHMFHSVGPMMDLGAKNVAKVREILANNAVDIIGEDVGGTHGRSVEFNLDTGQVKISSMAENIG